MKLLQKREETNPFAFMRRITDELDRAFGADRQRARADLDPSFVGGARRDDEHRCGRRLRFGQREGQRLIVLRCLGRQAT